jgi:hypothetical protein
MDRGKKIYGGNGIRNGDEEPIRKNSYQEGKN